MKKLLLWSLCVVLIAGCTESPEDRIDNLLSRGTEQLDRYQFAEADSTFAELNKLAPTLPGGAYGEALSLERQLLYYDALAAYYRILDGNASYSPVLRGVVRVLEALDEKDYRAVAARRATAVPDARPADFLELARALVSLRDHGPALAALERAEEAGIDDGSAAAVRAEIFFQQGMVDSADAAFARALDDGNTSAEFCTVAADYLETAGLLDSAIAFSSRSTKAEGHSSADVMRHFRRCLRLSYFRETRQVIAAVRAEDSMGIVTAPLEVFYGWKTGHSFMATQASIKMRSRSDYYVSSLVYEIDSRWMVGDIGSCEGNEGMTKAMMDELGFPDDARAPILNRLALRAANWDILQSAGVKTRLSPGCQGWLPALKLQEVELMLKAGMKDSVAVRVDSIHTRFSDDPRWMTSLADMYARRDVHEYDLAEAAYAKALRADPFYRQALENQLDLYVTLRRFADGLKLVNSYPEMVARHSGIALRKARFLGETGDIDGAVALFAKTIGVVSGQIPRYEEFLRLLARKGRMAEQQRVVALALELQPENPDAYLLAARFEGDQGNLERARSLAESGLEREPDNLSLTAQKAWALYGLGEPEMAVALFEEALKKDYGNIDVNVVFARALASDKRDLARAEFVAKQASFFSMSSLPAVVALCEIYDAMGQPKRMKGEARRVTGRFANEPEPFYYLGIGLMPEDAAEARKNLNKAIELGLWGDRLSRARELLGRG
ncbi:MAG: hypothetical protein KKA42_03925 [candidate division Zixibacteria bacterium]|nr:hypothetical protein [candidate division Zixibacteria bacterium]